MKRQKILVFQQNKSGESKIKGILKEGKGKFQIEVVNIDQPLPPLIDDATPYLPQDIEADIVLDYLKHPDLSYDLATLCKKKGIPLIVSGKKIRLEGVYSPPT